MLRAAVAAILYITHSQRADSGQSLVDSIGIRDKLQLSGAGASSQRQIPIRHYRGAGTHGTWGSPHQQRAARAPRCTARSATKLSIRNRTYERVIRYLEKRQTRGGSGALSPDARGHNTPR